MRYNNFTQSPHRGLNILTFCTQVISACHTNLNCILDTAKEMNFPIFLRVEVI